MALQNGFKHPAFWPGIIAIAACFIGLYLAFFVFGKADALPYVVGIVIGGVATYFGDKLDRLTNDD